MNNVTSEGSRADLREPPPLGAEDLEAIEAMREEAAAVDGADGYDAPKIEEIVDDGLTTVLTAQNGDYGHFGESLRKSAALVRQGGIETLYVARGQRATPAVAALVELLIATEKKSVVDRIQYTDAANVAQIYATAQSFAPEDEPVGDEQRQEMEIKAINLFRYCVASGATDLHVWVLPRRCLMRMRIDGSLTVIENPLFSPEEGRRFLRVVFAMAQNTDPTYRATESQDASLMKAERGDLPPGIDAIRMKFVPLGNKGRYAAVRFQKVPPRKFDVAHDVDALGFEEDQVAAIKRMRSQTSGCVAIVGPTGSGKSQTLQVTLAARNRELDGRKAIFTVEDPIELEIEGAAQRSVNAGNTAEDRRRAFQIAVNDVLRQDPDIVMIGEIRDRESGRLCFTIAQTGHLVFTTVHANSALAAITRLRDEGVESFKLADPSLVIGLVSQRLVPVLCPNCARPFDKLLGDEKDVAWRDRGLRDELERAGTALTRAKIPLDEVKLRGPGCKHRHNGRQCRAGYVGRTVVAEVVEPDAILLELMTKGLTRYAERYWLEHLGGRTIVERALRRVAQGTLDPRDAAEAVGQLTLPQARAAIERKPMTADEYEALLRASAI